MYEGGEMGWRIFEFSLIANRTYSLFDFVMFGFLRFHEMIEINNRITVIINEMRV